MLKTLIAGILLGIAAGVAALHYLPSVNQSRENSMITVTRNGGNSETFHANVPMDRIMIGAPGRQSPLPVGLEWPDDEHFANARAELFKIRNAKDAVVGVASRIAASNQDGEIIEWVLHLPARGSAYVIMQTAAADGGYRVGDLRAGTHEFRDLLGRVTERWVADTSGAEDAPTGKIELIATFVSAEERL